MSDDTKDHKDQINGLNNTVNTLFQSYVQEIFLNKDSKSLKKDRKNAASNNYTDINLSQHLRLRRSRRSSGLKSTSDRKVNLTQDGYNNMTKELGKLQKERIKITSEIEKAAADGDVRENAPLEAARESQGMVMSKIREIESTLKIAEIIDSNTDKTKVQIGSKVLLIQSNSNAKLEYQLVEPREASPLQKKISIGSPVGEAILGRRVGDEVNVATPQGQITYRVEKTS